MTKHITDLLYGFSSKIPNSNKHVFLADLDIVEMDKIEQKVREILFKKYKFGDTYLILSSFKKRPKFHLVNFSERLSLRKLIRIAKEMEIVDPSFLEWGKKVGYLVLRVSRRSGHFCVPKLVKVFRSPYRKKEVESMKLAYFMLLKIEDSIKEVKRVEVHD